MCQLQQNFYVYRTVSVISCRFPWMATLCAHVKNEHNAIDAVIQQVSFETLDQVGSL